MVLEVAAVNAAQYRQLHLVVLRPPLDKEMLAVLAQKGTSIQRKAVVAAARVLRGKLATIGLLQLPQQPQALVGGLAQRPVFPALALRMVVAAALVQAFSLHPAVLAALAVVETVLMWLMPQVLMEQQIEVVVAVVALVRGRLAALVVMAVQAS